MMHEDDSTVPFHHSPDGAIANRHSSPAHRELEAGGGGGSGDEAAGNPFEGTHTASTTQGAYTPALTHGVGEQLAGGLASARQMASGMLSSLALPSSEDTNEYFAAAARASRTGGLHKVLGWKELISLGVGCTIGAGIFVVTGVVAATKAGPALFLCYIISAIACGLAGLCYSELASMAPAAGSAYSYARASMGETIGWIIGWDLTLEYAVSGASVAQGWSKYFVELLGLMGIHFPHVLSAAPWAYDANSGSLTSTGAVLDLPALLITLAITWLLLRGMRESALFAKIMVILKVTIVLFVIFAGIAYMDAANFSPFMPFGFFGISFFGWTAVGQTGPDGGPVGVFAGAAIVFFAYIGFDTVTCQAEETRNPQRDLPIGIIGSLAISTVLYVAVSLVLVGMVPYHLINIDAPLSQAFGQHGMHWAEFIIAIGAVVGITSVLLVTLMGQPRILMAMARDGLLPEKFFSAVHPVYGTPHKSTMLTGGIVALLASLIPLSVLVELVSIGTLLAFCIVSIAVLVLRRSAPDVHRPFRCPGVPYVPVAGALVCALLMLSLPSSNWIRLIVWLGIGIAIYLVWGRHNAKRLRDLRRLAATAAAGGAGGSADTSQIEMLERGGDDDGRGAVHLDADALLHDPPSSLSFSRNVFEQPPHGEHAEHEEAAPAAEGDEAVDPLNADHSALELPAEREGDIEGAVAAAAAGDNAAEAEYVSPTTAAREASKGLLRQAPDEEGLLGDDAQQR